MNSKNLEKLITEALAIEHEEAAKAGALGYMARALIQATLPHSQNEDFQFIRKNGAFKLTITSDQEVGLPYGSIPRLLLAWITTEAVRTRERELTLGKTLSEFMSEIGLIPSGGRWGTITRLKDQMKRLFSSTISFSYSENEAWRLKHIFPVESVNLWWDPKSPEQATLWESTLLLGESFFEEIVNNPVPIDLRALKALKRSPMALDIYCWLTYRMSYLRKITEIPWPVLQLQFGAEYKDTKQFKRRFLDQLKKIQCIYPEARVKHTPDNFIIMPSKLHIRDRPVDN